MLERIVVTASTREEQGSRSGEWAKGRQAVLCPVFGTFLGECEAEHRRSEIVRCAWTTRLRLDSLHGVLPASKGVYACAKRRVKEDN